MGPKGDTCSLLARKQLLSGWRGKLSVQGRLGLGGFCLLAGSPHGGPRLGRATVDAPGGSESGLRHAEIIIFVSSERQSGIECISKK